MKERYENLNPLAADQEALTILMEECGEVAQAASKCIRFNGGADNKGRLSGEIGDLLAIIEILFSQGLVDESLAAASIDKKKEKLKFYSNLEF